MSPSVQQTLERVYAVFGDVPRPVNIRGCPCCIDRKNLDPLLAKPLRSLLPEDLANYAASALLTVGEPEDYVYFLPHILEILIIEPHWRPDVEVVAQAINSAGFPGWSNTRRKAVTNHLDAVIDEIFAKEGAAAELDQWLCAVGTLGTDLTPFLACCLVG